MVYCTTVKKKYFNNMWLSQEPLDQLGLYLFMLFECTFCAECKAGDENVCATVGGICWMILGDGSKIPGHGPGEGAQH